MMTRWQLNRDTTILSSQKGLARPRSKMEPHQRLDLMQPYLTVKTENPTLLSIDVVLVGRRTDANLQYPRRV